MDATTVRFVITGGSAAALFFALSLAAARAGLPPFAGTLLAYAATFAAAYVTQQAWTFRGTRRHSEALPRYLLAQLACALGSAMLARLLGADLGVPPLPMAAVTTLASSAASYALSRFWVFARGRGPA